MLLKVINSQLASGLDRGSFSFMGLTVAGTVPYFRTVSAWFIAYSTVVQTDCMTLQGCTPFKKAHLNYFQVCWWSLESGSGFRYRQVIIGAGQEDPNNPVASLVVALY